MQNKAIELIENDFYDFTNTNIYGESQKINSKPLLVPNNIFFYYKTFKNQTYQKSYTVIKKYFKNN